MKSKKKASLGGGLFEARRILRVEARAILQTAGKLNASYLKAEGAVARCRGKVCVTGMGKSGSVARKISGTLSSVGIPSFFLSPAEALHGDMGALSSHDLLLVISYSGKTVEVEDFLDSVLAQKSARGQKVRPKIIAFTGNDNSPLAKKSDIHLNVAVSREACPLNLAPTASTAVALALGDALALTAAKRKGYSTQTFAARHPAGALGSRLRSGVDKFVIRGRKLGWVSGDMPLEKVAEVMGRFSVGAVVVRGIKTPCAGIIVDGDLRRAFARSNAKDLCARHIMSRSPVEISHQSSVSDALQIMESRAIYHLLVRGPAKNSVGLLHIHDLLGRGRIRLAPDSAGV